MCERPHMISVRPRGGVQELSKSLIKGLNSIRKMG